jgi:hypothetical protein
MLCAYAVIIDDVIHRPVVELERIMTFAGVPLPDRPKMIQAASKLQTELRDAFGIYDNMTFVYGAVDKVVLEAGSAASTI